jgi:hypothetical protein
MVLIIIVNAMYFKSWWVLLPVCILMDAIVVVLRMSVEKDTHNNYSK